MLSEFIANNRSEIIARCRSRVQSRMAPRATAFELEQGIPIFLAQLVSVLDAKLETPPLDHSATRHGKDLLRMGFTIAQVVHDYGDVCQTITELAIERMSEISNVEFQMLNRTLDDAIASAVTEYARQREVDIVAEDTKRSTEDLGFFAHELRNLIGTATLAFDALRHGSVGAHGSTAAVMDRSLERLRALVDRSLSAVRLKAGVDASERVVICELVEEIEVSAMMEAKARGHHFGVEVSEPRAVVLADRQILASIVVNLVQNAFKYTHAHSHVTLRTSATADRVRIEVEDQCGGLPPGKAEALFAPFRQASSDRSGLGLGLAICVQGALALGGTLDVRDLSGKGCVFSLELPRAA